MSAFSGMGKLLIVVGIALVIIGVLISLAGKIPYLGKLPGDIRIEKKHVSFYFPIATCLLLSIILTIILNLFRR